MLCSPSRAGGVLHERSSITNKCVYLLKLCTFLPWPCFLLNVVVEDLLRRELNTGHLLPLDARDRLWTRIVWRRYEYDKNKYQLLDRVDKLWRLTRLEISRGNGSRQTWAVRSPTDRSDDGGLIGGSLYWARQESSDRRFPLITLGLYICQCVIRPRTR